ncbi:alpha/beta fold hydrolase [Pseudomonas sp.]|uniref:alpha/beta fold hydrolase n=1 Tax=Pseudomonas sp. TaxID=306 RepID=UPI003D6DD588
MNQAQHPIQTGYAPINGLQLYFEVHGAERQVIAFEQQGYGHTADIVDRPFTFEQSADDTAALLAYLHIDQADLFGFSNGGTIALQVAIRHPQRVRKLVLASALVNRAGAYPWLWQAMANATLENMPQELQDEYLKVAPHPENLRLMHDKAAQRVRDFKDIPSDAIGTIAARTLVVVGDADVIQPEHAVEMFRLLPHAQLVVLPGTDHMQVTSRTEWLVPMISDFLDQAVQGPES